MCNVKKVILWLSVSLKIISGYKEMQECGKAVASGNDIHDKIKIKILEMPFIVDLYAIIIHTSFHPAHT